MESRSDRDPAAGQPDWEFWVEDGAPVLTEEQAELLAELEIVLSGFGRDEPNPEEFIPAITPILKELQASGLSAKRIADNSRIRPEAVARLLN